MPRLTAAALATAASIFRDPMLPAEAPQAVNGYPVLKAARTDARGATRAGWIILVDRAPDYPDDRYVTAWIGDGDRSWWHGHYIADPIEARGDYRERFLRGY
jgi:hypothetical protein